MKVFGVCNDATFVFVYPARATTVRRDNAFTRVSVRPYPPHIRLYRIFADPLPGDLRCYLAWGIDERTLRRMDKAVCSVASLLGYDEALSAYDNVLAMTAAVRGALEQEGLA